MQKYMEKEYFLYLLYVLLFCGLIHIIVKIFFQLHKVSYIKVNLNTIHFIHIVQRNSGVNTEKFHKYSCRYYMKILAHHSTNAQIRTYHPHKKLHIKIQKRKKKILFVIFMLYVAGNNCNTSVCNYYQLMLVVVHVVADFVV